MKPADTNDLKVLAIQPRRTSREVEKLDRTFPTSAVLSLTPLPGGNSAAVPPVPIPNTEVKCSCVDGSATYVCVRVDHCQAPILRPQLLLTAVFSFLIAYFLTLRLYVC